MCHLSDYEILILDYESFIFQEPDQIVANFAPYQGFGQSSAHEILEHRNALFREVRATDDQRNFAPPGLLVSSKKLNVARPTTMISVGPSGHMNDAKCQLVSHTLHP